MPVDAVGSVLGATNSTASARSTISQEDFIRLFLAQLQFQDPLEPLDNREFLSQLASFSGLEQAKQTTAGVENLLFMSSGDQALGLLDRDVRVNASGTTVQGSVTSISFSASGAVLTVQPASGAPLTGIRLSQISLVQP